MSSDQPIWMDVLPSLRNFAPELTKGTKKAAEDAGKASGGAWSKTFEKSAGDDATKSRVVELEKAAKQAQRAIDTETQNIGRARASQREAVARVVEAEAKLDAARAKGDPAKVAAAELRLEAARDRSKAAASKVESTENALRAAHREQTVATEQLEAATRDLGQETEGQVGAWARMKSSMGGAREESSKTEGGLGKLVGKLAAVAAGAAVMGTALTGSLDLESGQAKMTAALDLTAEQSATAGEVAGALYSAAYGESMTDVTGAVQSVMSSIEGMSSASPAELESVTAAGMNLADVFGIDVSESAAAAGLLIKNGLAADATGAFDLMFASLQRVPEAMQGEVIDAANEYGGVFATLGLSGEQAMGMLVAASDGGSIAIDKVGDSLKEFTIRATDMSTASTAAYDTLGLDAKSMANDLLAGGDTAAAATQKIVDGLLGIKDPATQANTAIALFGTPLEDLGVSEIPAFLEGLSAMDTSLGDVEGKAAGVAETMGGTTSTSLESFKRGFIGVLSEGIEPLLGPAQTVLDWVSSITPGFTDIIGILFQGDYTGGLFESFGIAEDSAFVDFLFDVRDGVTGVTAILFQGDYTSAMSALGFEEDSELVDFLFDVREGVMAFGTYLQDEAIPALQSFGGWVVDNKDWLLAVGVALTAGAAAFGLWTAATKTWTIATNAAKAAQAAFTVVMNANPIMLIVTAIAALVGGLIYFFTQTETGKAAWETFTTAIGVAWDWVGTKLSEGWTWIQTYVFEPVKTGVSWVGDAFVSAKDGIGVAWAAVQTGLKAGWDFIYTWVIKPYVDGFQWIWDKVVTVKDNVVAGWNLMRDGLKAGADWIGTYVFDPLKVAVGWVGDAFDNTAAFVDTAWGKIKEAAAKPVNFIIDTVYNQGIKATWDKITSAVGLSLDLPTGNKIAFADGGVMPGYTPGRDVHRFVSPTGGVLELSGGEPILRPEVGKVLGPGWVHGVNAAARSGGVGGVQSYLGGGHQAFAGGGFWNWAGGVVSDIGSGLRSAGDWIKDGVLNVASFLADPVSGITDLISAPMEQLLSSVMGGSLGKAMIEYPRSAVEGLIEKAKALIGLGGDSAGGGVLGGAAPAMTGGWVRPSKGPVTSRYGPRWGAFHNGIDIAGGGPTYAIWPGRVAKTGWGVGYGNTGIGILLDHANGLQSYYGHNPVGGVKVNVGQTVAAGQHIGAQGATGNVTGVHLHHSVFRNGKAINPEQFGVFDTGGYLEPNSLAMNLSNQPEPVLTSQQWDAMYELAGRGMTTPDTLVVVDADGHLIGRMRIEADRAAGVLVGAAASERTVADRGGKY